MVMHSKSALFYADVLLWITDMPGTGHNPVTNEPFVLVGPSWFYPWMLELVP